LFKKKKNSSIEVISRFGPKSITVDLHLTEREKKREIFEKKES